MKCFFDGVMQNFWKFVCWNFAYSGVGKKGIGYVQCFFWMDKKKEVDVLTNRFDNDKPDAFF